MLKTCIIVSYAISVLVLILSATPAVPAANSAVKLQVSWIDWPNENVRKQEADNYEGYRDPKLEDRLVRVIIRTLRAADVRTRPDADLVVQINVIGTTIDRRYIDSLYGTVSNRPTQYAGKYVVEIYRGGKTVSHHSDKFSFNSSYASGRTSTATSKIKVTGLVNDWLENYIKKRKFREALTVPTLKDTQLSG